MSMNRLTPSAPAVAECLESRTLLSGNVVARVVAGDLVLRGDGAGNNVLIQQDGRAGRFIVRPSDGITTINGRLRAAVLRGARRDIKADLAGGNDVLEIRGGAFRRQVQINGGVGSDIITVQAVDTRRAAIVGAGGNDQINLVDGSVSRAVAINGSAGRDLITADGTDVRGRASIRGAAGSDTFYLSGARFATRPTVDSRRGDRVVTNAVSVRSDFGGGTRGWNAGYSDYPSGQGTQYQLAAGIRPLPTDLGANRGNGFMVSGNNRNRDLFAFLKRRLGRADTLSPNSTYQVRYVIRLASNLTEQQGEDVALKAGAAATEPRGNMRDPRSQLIMNVNKGDQEIGGPAASVAGVIGNGTAQARYRSLDFKHVHTTLVTTNARGELWALVGVDSGFQGMNTIYFQNIDIRLVPVGGGNVSQGGGQ